MPPKKSPLEKEWTRLEKNERSYLQKRKKKKDSGFNRFLEDKVPETLQYTLDTAFSKAFTLIFEKGTGIIEKMYNRNELKNTYKANEYATQLSENRKALMAFSKSASGAGNKNILISGVSGIGLGLLGIGIPDIALFTGTMLKSIYEIALNYGFDYDSQEEQIFILYLIQGAVSYGDDLIHINNEINHFIEHGKFSRFTSLYERIPKTAGSLSKELLYMKFLQGIPIVGAVGGGYDVVYMKQVVKYVEMKYRRRFYAKRMNKQ